MITKQLSKWEPDLSKSIEDLLIDWYLEVTEHVIFQALVAAGILNTEITGFHRRDDKYNRVIFTKDVQFEIRPASANYPNLEFPSEIDYDRQWHDDGPMYSYVIMWTNVDSTLVRAKGSDKIFMYLPNDVYIIDNKYYEHRRSDLVNNDRLFARALISKDIGEFLG